MKHLKVVPDDEELMIISDRHSEIIDVSEIYKFAHHGHCIWYLSPNMKNRCKKKGAIEMFMRLAKIYKQCEFDFMYQEFKKRYLEAGKFLDSSTVQDLVITL